MVVQGFKSDLCPEFLDIHIRSMLSLDKDRIEEARIRKENQLKKKRPRQIHYQQYFTKVTQLYKNLDVVDNYDSNFIKRLDAQKR